MTTKDILKENDRRLAELYAPYNPLSGRGSSLERFAFNVDEGSQIWLPEIMRPFVSEIMEYPNLREYTRGFGNPDAAFSSTLSDIFMQRIIDDFEFWAATCVFIQDKKTKKEIKFILRLPQRLMLKELMADFWAGVPIRLIILKARQWGGSTLAQLFMAWLQIFHFVNWHSAIVTDIEDQARNIRAMYTRMALRHPAEIAKITFAPHEGSAKNRVLLERGNIISIGSMQSPEGLRSSDIMMIHKSEVGLWKKTKGRSPEDLIQSLSGIPLEHGTVEIEESTAKGSGNYFNKAWDDAVSGLSKWRHLFVPWYQIDIYQKPFESFEEKYAFAEHLDEYQKFLWSEGATLEGINWYQWKRVTSKWSSPDRHWRMQAEYPTTPEEAFQSTGRRVFAPMYVSSNRRFCKDPKFVGEVYADAMFGTAALSNIRFEEVPDGDLWIWAFPAKERNIDHRYEVVVDIGASGGDSSYSVIRVIDRFDLMYGGTEEAVLTWRGHLDQDLVVWKAVQIATMYHDALLTFESNPIKARETEGDHTITILDEIAEVYPNLFCRSNPESIKEGEPLRYGFHTNVKTKTDFINAYKKRLREGGYIERDRRVFDEADKYEHKENGRMKTIDGGHDDILECTMIGLKVSELMPMPCEINIRVNQKGKIRTYNEATF